MSNGLVIVKNETMAKVYALNFHLYTDMNCLHFSGSSAISQFKELIPYLDVLIIDPSIGSENIVEQLDELFSEENISIPTIVLSRIEVETENNCFYYQKDISVKNIIKKVGQVLDITAQDMVAKVLPERIPLHINYFKDLNKAPCEIYVREIDENSQYKYHQIYEKGSEVDPDHLTLIQVNEKKSKLFIPKMERLKFVNYYTAQLGQNQINEAKNNKKDIQSFLQMSRDNLASVISNINEIEEIMDIADQSITTCLKEVEEQGDKRLIKYINELVQSTDSYILQQAQVSSYIAFKLLKKLNWLSMSQKRTFVSAAFFKNILLNSEQEDLAKVRSQEALDKLKHDDQITQEEYNLIKNMPQRTVGVLSSSKKQNFPENTLTIIREQNGNKTGVGFQRDSEKHLHSLSIAFIVANSFADKILIEGIDDEMVIINELEREFEGKSKFLSYIDLLNDNKEDAA